MIRIIIGIGRLRATRFLIGAALCTAIAFPAAATVPNPPDNGTPIRCIPPNRHEGLAAPLDGVRFPFVFRTLERFGEIEFPSVPFAAPYLAPQKPDEPREPFVPVRISDTRVSMRDEMVTARDFDNGRIRAMTVRDGTGPLRLRGFVCIPTVWGVRFAPPENLRSAPIMIAEAVKRYTGIEARMDGHLMLTDRRLFSTPFLYITAAENFDLTRQEYERLGEYLRSGGFAFLEDAPLESNYYRHSAREFAHGPGGTSLKHMLRDALGCHARLEPIPLGHPLYHCLFDFIDGPPRGDENKLVYTRINSIMTSTSGEPLSHATLQKHSFALYGVFLDGRLVAVLSEKSYGPKWARQAGAPNNSPQMKFAANLVVYALTRDGGMTDRIMGGFADAW